MASEEAGGIEVRVLETVVLHAADAIYWLDGTTDETVDKMQRISRPLVVEYTERPRNIEVLSKAGATAFWRNSDGAIIPGVATDQQKKRGVATPFAVAGIVRESRGLYNPRVFAVTLGSGDGHGIELFPSPAGTRWPTAGGLRGTLALAGTGRPVPWALLELSVDVSSDTMVFRAQADANGDFALTTGRLPPLPSSVTAYPALLSLRASLSADGKTPVNIDVLDTVHLGELAQDSFGESISLDIRPGEIRRINSKDVTYLAVKAAP